MSNDSLRAALENLVAEWREQADSDERYLNRAHASEIHEVEASVRLNREYADAIAGLLAAHPAESVPLELSDEEVAGLEEQIADTSWVQSVPVADRERVVRVLEAHNVGAHIPPTTRLKGYRMVVADALLAAGVFSQPPARSTPEAEGVRSEAVPPSPASEKVGMVALDREAVERAARAQIAEWYGSEWDSKDERFYETEDGGVTGSEDTEAMLELRGVRLALDESAKLARPEAVVKAEALREAADDEYLVGLGGTQTWLRERADELEGN